MPVVGEACMFCGVSMAPCWSLSSFSPSLPWENRLPRALVLVPACGDRAQVPGPGGKVVQVLHFPSHRLSRLSRQPLDSWPPASTPDRQDCQPAPHRLCVPWFPQPISVHSRPGTRKQQPAGVEAQRGGCPAVPGECVSRASGRRWLLGGCSLVWAWCGFSLCPVRTDRSLTVCWGF